MNEVEDQMIEAIDEKPKRGPKFQRPPRPDIRLTSAYASKIGAECGKMANTVDECHGALLSVDRYLAEELQSVARRLHEMCEVFQ
jgi:hypothetical protein